MTQYIPKAALVAEIERLFKKAEKSSGEYKNGAIHTLITLKDKLGTLETKEVDLDDDVDKILEANDWNFDKIDFYQFAKHFFELGLFSQLTWQDIRLIAEIGEDFMNSEESDNLSDEEYYTAILNMLKSEGRDCKTSRQRIRDTSNAQKGE